MPRKEKKYFFIYKTTNILNGKYYYGMHCTNNLDDGYLGSGKRLKYSLKKYGIHNHKREIIEFCNSREELYNREKEIVNLNEIAKNNCMNITIGGYGGWPEKCKFKKNNKFANMGAKAYIKRLKEDPEFWISRIEIASNIMKKCHSLGKMKYDGFKGKHHTEETKNRLSEKGKLRIGNKSSQFGTYWITNGVENKKIKKEDLEKYMCNGWNKGRTIKNNPIWDSKKYKKKLTNVWLADNS